MKKQFLCLIALAGLLCSASVQAATSPTAAPAATASKPMSAQNSRMKDCAAQYHQKNLPKSQYKTFMSGCLKNPSTASSAPSATASGKTITPTAAPAPAAMAPSTMTPPASAMKP